MKPLTTIKRPFDQRIKKTFIVISVLMLCLQDSALATLDPRSKNRLEELQQKLLQANEERRSQIRQPDIFKQLPQIIIYSPTHNNEAPTEVNHLKGVMEVRVVTRFRILKLVSSSEFEQTPDNLGVKLKIPYELSKETEEVIHILVETEQGTLEKEFRIFWKEKPKVDAYEKKRQFSDWRFTLISGLSHNNNLYGSPGGIPKIGATSFSLIFTPRYTTTLFEKKVNFDGIFLREKQTDPDNAPFEIIYDQLSLSWEHKTEALGPLDVKIGLANVGTDIEWFKALNQVQQEAFLELSIEPTKDWKIQVKTTSKEMSPVEDEQYNGDANLYSLQGSLKTPYDQHEMTYKAQWVKNEAVGPYKDYHGVALNLAAEFPKLNQFKATLEASYRTRTFSEDDPLKGDKEKSQASKISGKLERPLKEGLALIGEFSWKRQSSNIEKANFHGSIASIKLLSVF